MDCGIHSIIPPLRVDCNTSNSWVSVCVCGVMCGTHYERKRLKWLQSVMSGMQWIGLQCKYRNHGWLKQVFWEHLHGRCSYIDILLCLFVVTTNTILFLWSKWSTKLYIVAHTLAHTRPRPIIIFYWCCGLNNLKWAVSCKQMMHWTNSMTCERSPQRAPCRLRCAAFLPGQSVRACSVSS